MSWQPNKKAADFSIVVNDPAGWTINLLEEDLGDLPETCSVCSEGSKILPQQANGIVSYAGTTLDGTVFARIYKPMKASRCNLMFVGREVGVVGHAGGRDRFTKKKYLIRLNVPLTIDETAASEKMIKDGKLVPGDYEIPFSFRIPSHLPSSLNAVKHSQHGLAQSVRKSSKMRKSSFSESSLRSITSASTTSSGNVQPIKASVLSSHCEISYKLQFSITGERGSKLEKCKCEETVNLRSQSENDSSSVSSNYSSASFGTGSVGGMSFGGVSERRKPVPLEIVERKLPLNLLGIFVRGNIKVKARLSDTVLLTDDSCPSTLRLELQNRSNVKLISIRIELVQIIKWSSEGLSTCSVQQVLYYTDISHRNMDKLEDQCEVLGEGKRSSSIRDEQTYVVEERIFVKNTSLARPSYKGKLVSVNHAIHINFQTKAFVTNPHFVIPVRLAYPPQRITRGHALASRLSVQAESLSSTFQSRLPSASFSIPQQSNKKAVPRAIQVVPDLSGLG